MQLEEKEGRRRSRFKVALDSPGFQEISQGNHKTLHREEKKSKIHKRSIRPAETFSCVSWKPNLQESTETLSFHKLTKQSDDNSTIILSLQRTRNTEP
jgi:hypothetical protein